MEGPYGLSVEDSDQLLLTVAANHSRLPFA